MVSRGRRVSCAAAVALGIAGITGAGTPAEALWVPGGGWGSSPVGQPVAIAHRGDHDRAVENTRRALVNASRSGVSIWEIDVRFTADGVPVLMHDARVDRTTRGSGRVAALRLARLRAMRTNDGQLVPTLQEVLSDARRRGARVLLELKTRPTAPQLRSVLQRIDREGMRSRVVVMSFDQTTVRLVDRASPVATGLITRTAVDPATARSLGTTLAVRSDAVTPEAVAGWRAAGVRVLAWTPNASAEWERLAAAGVDGLITDEADELAASRR